eukprot:scaffold2357_cov167-Amphora_coffeaeformis.AAC.20
MTTMNRLVAITVALLLSENATLAFMPHCLPVVAACRLSDSSGWGDFEAMDDPLLDEDIAIDTREYAVENDPDEVKAQVGASLEAPEITDPSTDAIWVPAGSQLELDEETVLGVLQAAREELGTLFGYSAENRGVGITGGVDFVEMDGPTVVVRLKGRFWHTRNTVLDRVSNYLQQRIPEIVDVDVEDPYQLTDEANETGQDPREILDGYDDGGTRHMAVQFLEHIPLSRMSTDVIT